MNSKGEALTGLLVVVALWMFVAGALVQRKVNGQVKPQPQRMAQPSNFYGPYTPQ